MPTIPSSASFNSNTIVKVNKSPSGNQNASVLSSPLNNPNESFTINEAEYSGKQISVVCRYVEIIIFLCYALFNFIIFSSLFTLSFFLITTNFLLNLSTNFNFVL